MTLTYIFDFECLKYVKFVHFRMLPETKIMKNSAIHIQTFAIERRKSRFCCSVTLTYIFDFKCLQYFHVKFIHYHILPIASNYEKFHQFYIQTFVIERRKYRFSPP